jgi:tetratricopeptide (TPR) repeat protein
VYISEAEFSGRRQTAEAAEPGATVARSRNAKFWVGVAAAVAVVASLTGLLKPGGQAADPAASNAPVVAAQQAQPVPHDPAATPASQHDAPVPAAPDSMFKPGDLGQALEHYRAALAEKPADPELLNNVGQILVSMNRPADAVPFLEKAVEAEPFSVAARFDLAAAYARGGRLKDAIDQYEALVASGAADIRVHHNLGLALRQLGRNAEAAAAFERATAIAPDKAPGWLGLALSLEADGRSSAAADALERYLMLEPAGPDADNVRARIARLRAVAEPASPPPDAGNALARRRP